MLAQQAVCAVARTSGMRSLLTYQVDILVTSLSHSLVHERVGDRLDQRLIANVVTERIAQAISAPAVPTHGWPRLPPPECSVEGRWRVIVKQRSAVSD
jgi:hypothetical protein